MEPRKRIKVLLVDDSPLAVAALSRVLASAPDIEVVGSARNGKEALELIPALEPDVVCTDLYMPVMDGLQLTRELMARHPRPVLVVSVAVRSDEPYSAFQLLEAGAVDVFPKPRLGLDPKDRRLADELIRKIRVLSGVVVSTRAPPVPVVPPRKETGPKRADLVAMGASTGGPQALQTILSRLSADFPAPILCVQHIGAGFTGALMEWLQTRVRLRIGFAEPWKVPMAGHVYFPPEGSNLELDGYGRMRVGCDGAPHERCPSVDATFRSVAEHWRGRAAGVLLSGMGSDGAAGMLALAQAGGLTVAQDEATSIVFGMPASAIANGSVQHILPLTRIADLLIECAAR